MAGIATGEGPIRHGGDLGEARRRFPGAPEPWIDLSTGINPVPYPCPPIEASHFERLPAPDDLRALQAAAAGAYGAAPGQVVAAPGTQALIALLPRLRPAGRVAVVAPTYAEHAAGWRRAGHAVAAVAGPEESAGFDVAVVVTPNNPDGRRWAPGALAAFAGRLAPGGWLVVDEAFADLEPGPSLCPVLPANAIVLRSFGKTYGLAGLRLGFAVAAPDLAAAIRDGLGPWAVSGPAIAVGRRALADAPWRERARADRARDAARLDGLLERAGGRIVGGTCLFRTAAFAHGPALFEALGRAGIHVRRFDDDPGRLRFGLPAGETQWRRLDAVLAPVAASRGGSATG
ncbi:threonine-phosphate decarboxylase CobD [Methylobacterium oryzihabitans]|uniref:8-amino-7-oxononanoate synthase n=1 Tax=Methylobacterium oryzihabitans TaxID=2499852 RepID=A0A437PEE1_9HYPH|nr:threonine-phosphate decarboxylase CobD [Methylobacterium oryzihabitans]RVU20599.1 threonine-phosphate decarboxylase [Methylobacterium oryzihabitans]